MTAKKPAEAHLRITQVRSAIGCPADQKATVKALGLKRMNHTVEKVDSPSIRGMIAKVQHLVKVDQA